MRRTNRPSYRRLQGTRLDSSKSIVNSEVRGKINHRERGTRDDSPKSIDRRQRGTRYDSPKLIVGSEVREYDSPKLSVSSEVREYDSPKSIVSESESESESEVKK